MQVPIRKPGKFTHQITDPHITKEKFFELQNQLKKLKEVRRPRASEEVQRLSLMGDFSENAAYQIAKGRLRGMNQEILDIENQLKRAIIIKPCGKSEKAQLGNYVTIKTSGREKTYLILGSSETDPASGIISHNSPIGLALLGKGVGDVFKTKLTNKEVEYKIIKIE